MKILGTKLSAGFRTSRCKGMELAPEFVPQRPGRPYKSAPGRLAALSSRSQSPVSLLLRNPAAGVNLERTGTPRQPLVPPAQAPPAAPPRCASPRDPPPTGWAAQRGLGAARTPSARTKECWCGGSVAQATEQSLSNGRPEARPDSKCLLATTRCARGPTVHS